jgi:hypothetical protein
MIFSMRRLLKYARVAASDGKFEGLWVEA